MLRPSPDNMQAVCKKLVHSKSPRITTPLGTDFYSNHFGKWLASWQFCTENGQWPVVVFKSATLVTFQVGDIHTGGKSRLNWTYFNTQKGISS